MRIKHEIKLQKNQRDSSIELLRMLAGMAVVILHFNYGSINAVDSSQGITHYVLMALEAICACAVNVFILISGYYNSTTNKLNMSRVVGLLIQTSIFGFSFELINCFISRKIILKNIIWSFVPINYYVILYCTLMFLTPYINIVISRLDKSALKRMLIIHIMLFSIYPTTVDVLSEILGFEMNGLSSIALSGSGGGYTIVHFVLMYVIGAIVRKLEWNPKETISIFLFFASAVIIFIWHIFLPSTGYMYCNPIMILEAVCVFNIFKQMNFYSNVINKIAPASFTCYLVHDRLLRCVNVESFINKTSWIVIMCLLFIVISIYLISCTIMIIWRFLSEPVKGKFGKVELSYFEGNE